jgi:hypothetical protein
MLLIREKKHGNGTLQTSHSVVCWIVMYLFGPYSGWLPIALGLTVMFDTHLSTTINGARYAWLNHQSHKLNSMTEPGAYVCLGLLQCQDVGQILALERIQETVYQTPLRVRQENCIDSLPHLSQRSKKPVCGYVRFHRVVPVWSRYALFCQLE